MQPVSGAITWQIRKPEEEASTLDYLQNINESFSFFALISFNNLWKEEAGNAENTLKRVVRLVLEGVYGIDVTSIEVHSDFALLRQELELLLPQRQLSINQLLQALGVFSMIALPEQLLAIGSQLQEFTPRERFTDYIPDLGYGPPRGYGNAPQFVAEAKRRERAKARAKSRRRRKRTSGRKRARYLARISSSR